MIQERLSNSYHTAQDRYRMTQERLSKRYIIAIERLQIGLGMITNDYPIDRYRKAKNGYWKMTEKNDKQTIKNDKKKTIRTIANDKTYNR